MAVEPRDQKKKMKPDANHFAFRSVLRVFQQCVIAPSWLANDNPYPLPGRGFIPSLSLKRKQEHNKSSIFQHYRTMSPNTHSVSKDRIGARSAPGEIADPSWPRASSDSLPQAIKDQLLASIRRYVESQVDADEARAQAAS